MKPKLCWSIGERLEKGIHIFFKENFMLFGFIRFNRRFIQRYIIK